MARKVYEVVIEVEGVPDGEGSNSMTINLLSRTLDGLAIPNAPGEVRAPGEHRRMRVRRMVRLD